MSLIPTMARSVKKRGWLSRRESVSKVEFFDVLKCAPGRPGNGHDWGHEARGEEYRRWLEAFRRNPADRESRPDAARLSPKIFLAPNRLCVNVVDVGWPGQRRPEGRRAPVGRETLPGHVELRSPLPRPPIPLVEAHERLERFTVALRSAATDQEGDGGAVVPHARVGLDSASTLAPTLTRSASEG